VLAGLIDGFNVPEPSLSALAELLDERTVVQISSNGSTAARTPVGCMTERGIRPIGQRWIIGGDNEQYRYQLQCTLNADGTSVTQTAVACAYYATGAKVSYRAWLTRKTCAVYTHRRRPLLNRAASELLAVRRWRVKGKQRASVDSP
jgi:hypothetical protein